MTKYLLGLLALVSIGAIIAYSANKPKETTTEEIHYHAGFQVYIDDQLQDYSSFEHMKIEPCSAEEHEELTPEEEQIEKAHLHDGVGDVVHVHRSQAKWSDLFTNINVELEDEMTAYTNGTEVENLLEKEIQPYESVVILIGENTAIEGKLASAISRDRIVEVEGMSENCGN